MVDTPAASNDGMDLPPVPREGEVAADLTAAATKVLTAATQQLDRMRFDAVADWGHFRRLTQKLTRRDADGRGDPGRRRGGDAVDVLLLSPT